MRKFGMKKLLMGTTAVTTLVASGYLMYREMVGGQRPLPTPKKNSYALITGASSGIGAEFARQLAALGYNLLLTARRGGKLAALAAELQTAHGITAEVITADLAQSDDVAQLESRIADLNLAVLVNNAGFGTTGGLLASDLEAQMAMLNVHITATMRLCRAALPGMTERGGGTIINVSSISAFFPSAGDVNYPASKAYLNVFSQALQAEVLASGIVVQALCPGFTVTEFHDTDNMTDFDREKVPSVLWMTAAEVVSTSLHSLNPNRVICIPGRRYQLMVAGVKSGPTALILKIARKFRQRVR
ncbi:MAG: SDR family oxidoreductase [Anaerolineae bacterium]|nr:SDR family oxidoreductase [Anaerolineae bacterium]